MIGQICACGIIVQGINNKQLRYNLTAHRKSKKHKRQFNAIKKSDKKYSITKLKEV